MAANGRSPHVTIGSIFHPSDFSEASEIAFTHALKIALLTKASFDVLHVSDGSGGEWTDFPGVRGTLERWKLIPRGSPRAAVAELGISVRKVVATSDDPVKASLHYLERHPADLVVLAVHQREGVTQWLGRVGTPIAQGAGEMTLFIPHGVEGFVSRTDGTVKLANILVPVASQPRPQPAVEATARLIRNFGLAQGTVTLLHVGKAGDMPALKIPEDTGWTWNRKIAAGEPVQAILETAAALPADLIVMTTEGRHGFLDALRGSTSERVLRKVRCPLASLPVGSMLG
jgi:nucleotide-binding universal stress UspA family protein